MVEAEISAQASKLIESNCRRTGEFCSFVRMLHTSGPGYWCLAQEARSVVDIFNSGGCDKAQISSKSGGTIRGTMTKERFIPNVD